MIDIISKLMAIKETAKDIHYTAKGEAFYSIHLLMDRVADDLDDYIDKIKEVVYLGNNTLPPKASAILTVARGLLPELNHNDTGNIAELKNLIDNTISAISDTLDNTYADKATQNLLGNIAEDLKLKSGLLWRQIDL